jgi:hypothetical protein
MYKTAPSISSDLLRELLVPSDQLMTDLNDSNGILATSLRCLALLGDVMTLCLPSPEEGDTPLSSARRARANETSRPIEWTALLEGLWKWYSRRPTDFQALIEFENHEATFPTILFTSAAGVSVNMIYHTAMLLLLTHWPPSIMLVDCFTKAGADHAQISPHWHARRVCGIALNSDPEHTRCWDPCMIAAFSLAARLTRNPNQRNDIFGCLNSVRTAGWRVDGLVRKLHEEWTQPIIEI